MSPRFVKIVGSFLKHWRVVTDEFDDALRVLLFMFSMAWMFSRSGSSSQYSLMRASTRVSVSVKCRVAPGLGTPICLSGRGKALSQNCLCEFGLSAAFLLACSSVILLEIELGWFHALGSHSIAVSTTADPPRRSTVARSSGRNASLCSSSHARGFGPAPPSRRDCFRETDGPWCAAASADAA